MPGLRKRTRPSSSRCRTKAGGDQYGQGLRSVSYTPNNLNQYTSRTVPGGFDVVGVANNAATVRVDGNDVQYRRGEYWRQYVSVDNTGLPVWRSVSVTTTGGGTTTGSVFVPKTAEAFGYDLDGNLTSEGRWTYVWDGENRLIRMVANTTVGPQQRIEFEYDWKGRRIGKKVWNNTQGTGNPSLTRKFLYDGWNLIAELDGNNALVRSYVWGLDASGSMQGAGGVGGLLMVKDAANGTHFAAYDLNGNVMGLVNAANGTISAQYEYGPFGEVTRMTGAMAKLNPFRFSTKYQDDETDLLYYGYRYYNASTGRWLSRDPIGELGGYNLYGFVGNDSISLIDILGFGEYVEGSTPPPNSQPLDGSTWNTMTGGTFEIAGIFGRAWATVAGGNLRGWEDAARHLSHFLQNSGSTYTIRFKGMNEESQSARSHYINELNDALAAAERLTEKKVQADLVTVREEAGNNTEGNRLFAVGRYRTWAKGHAKRLDCEDNYSLEWSFNFRDNYDWDLNNGLGGGLVTDREMALIHRYGRAREYEMIGEQKVVIKWKKGQRFESGAKVSDGEGRR